MVDKAVHFLDGFFTNDRISRCPILPSVAVVCVKAAPEPYCVCHNLILLNRDELVGEKDFAHHAQFYHMICLCLVFQYYGVIIQPLSWSDSWIPVGVASYLALQFVRKVVHGGKREA